MGSSYPWPSTVNVANFVTVKPCLEGDDERSNFKIWKEQMLCLLEGQDVIGFVDGQILPPENAKTEGLEKNVKRQHQQKAWRRTDRLVKGWILGSIGKDALDAVWEKQTARDVWLELDMVFNAEDDDEEESADYSRYLALYQAAQRGDWDTAQNFFKDITKLFTTIISSDSERALHVAVLTGKANDFVKKLVELMPPNDLALPDCYGDTALHNAAVVGNTEAAMALVDKHPGLLYILNKNNQLPVMKAAIFCQKKTLKYLISKYDDPNPVWNNPFQGQLVALLLNVIIGSGFLDIALDLAEKHPNLAQLTDKDGDSALSTIAETDTLFPRTETFTWWQKLIYHRFPLKMSKCEAAHTTSVAGDLENLSCDGAAHNSHSTSFQIISRVVQQKVESMIWNGIEHLVPKAKELKEKKERHEQALKLAEYLCDKIVSLPEKEASTIFETSIISATKNGTSEIVEMIMQKYPKVIFHEDDETGRDVFLLAASYRFENVINLFYNMSDSKYMFFDSTDDDDNNIMHICGKLAPPDRLNLVPGPALQMQRELQWFKEMKNFVNPSRRSWLNKENQTPQMIFTKEHEKLKAEGERWMKDTANACTISAALIATVVFTAAFTVPGGVESTTGVPLFSRKLALDIFAVSDAISLFTSIYSLLMFLSILTSRYAEEDFLYVLPKRLSIGLLSLFISITFMMVAFCATLFLLFRRDGTWFLLLLAAFACFPVASFVLLQFPLLVDVLYSTYGPGIFGKKTDRFIY